MTPFIYTYHQIISGKDLTSTPTRGLRFKHFHHLIHVTKIQNVINWRQNDSVCFHLIEASVTEARVLSDETKAKNL